MDKQSLNETAQTKNLKIIFYKAVAKEAGLTQDQVAKKMGTTQSAVARLEKGRPLPSMTSLQKYAAATNSKLILQLAPADS
jgi:transcriptional regulator with XRE-family HTH domain